MLLITTQNSSYLLDEDKGRVMRAPGEGAQSLIADGEWLYYSSASFEEGRPLVFDFPWEGKLKERTTTPIEAIDEIDLIEW